MLLRRKDGVTLIELLIVLSVMMFVITAASRLLTAMLTQFKQQSKIAESQLESVAALHILRSDLREAGFGLPYTFNVSMKYEEADDSLPLAQKFDDGFGVGATDPNGNTPRALIANYPHSAGEVPGLDISTAKGPTVNDSDYLVVKSMTAAVNDASFKYQYLPNNNVPNNWDPASDELETGDRFITLQVTSNGDLELQILPSGVWYGTFDTSVDTDTSSFAPSSKFITRLLYGVQSGVNLRFPFNRADYYVTNGSAPYSSATVVPSRCAPGTGVLVKAVLGHDDGDLNPNASNAAPLELPILDCVADMQVVFRGDTDGDGVTDAFIDEAVMHTKTSEEIRNDVREIWVYLLYHEGQYDPAYELTADANDTDESGDDDEDLGEAAGGRMFNLESWIPDAHTEALPDGTTRTITIADRWSHYRWKVATIVVKPEVLRGSL